MPELELFEWLKGEDIIGDTMLVFIDKGEMTTIPQGEGKEDKRAFEIGVSLPSGEVKKWTMNVTSQRAVAQGYGKNSDLWVGKTVTVFAQDQNVRGTPRKVIYARVPAAPQEETVGPAQLG